jgi:hypothetical protein
MPVPSFPGSAAIGNVGPSYAGPSGSQGIRYAPIETKIRAYLASVPVAQNIVEAAVQTYRTSGYSGFEKAVNFMSALREAGGASWRAYESRPYKGTKPGTEYKAYINRALNTALSRVGSNPLINAIVTFYKSIVAQVPDSEKNPDSWMSARLSNIETPPYWILGVTRIASGIF